MTTTPETEVVCPECGGAGEYEVVTRQNYDGSIETREEECEECSGAGNRSCLCCDEDAVRQYSRILVDEIPEPYPLVGRPPPMRTRVNRHRNHGELVPLCSEACLKDWARDNAIDLDAAVRP